MKTIILLLFSCVVLNAQTEDKRFTFAQVTSYTFNKEVNIGVDIDYQTNWFYIKAGIYVSPDYSDDNLSYFAHNYAIGYNKHSMFDNHRIYTGFKVDLVRMDGYPYVNYGFELGYDYYIKGFLIGIRPEYMFKNDRHYWKHNEGHKYQGKENYSELIISLKIGFEL